MVRSDERWYGVGQTATGEGVIRLRVWNSQTNTGAAVFFRLLYRYSMYCSVVTCCKARSRLVTYPDYPTDSLLYPDMNPARRSNPCDSLSAHSRFGNASTLSAFWRQEG
jgi:hypothetical protein